MREGFRRGHSACHPMEYNCRLSAIYILAPIGMAFHMNLKNCQYFMSGKSYVLCLLLENFGPGLSGPGPEIWPDGHRDQTEHGGRLCHIAMYLFIVIHT